MTIREGISLVDKEQGGSRSTQKKHNRASAQVSPKGRRTGAYAFRRHPEQARSQETVRAIMEAAADIISREGYARASTNRIAQRAGVSIGSLYQYFPNKQAILVRLLEDHVEDVTTHINQLIGRLADAEVPIEQTIRDILLAIVDRHAGQPRLHRVLAEETPQPPALIKRKRADDQRYAAEVEAALRRNSQVTVRDYRIAAHIVVQASAALSRWLVHSGPTDLNQRRFIGETSRMLAVYLTWK
ncbi:TetR family transcriptional regulator [candidate division GN15 bacterium]|nr:TetR family transcriptional regulator [candidate division GN15 bacterium]